MRRHWAYSARIFCKYVSVEGQIRSKTELQQISAIIIWKTALMA